MKPGSWPSTAVSPPGRRPEGAPLHIYFFHQAPIHIIPYAGIAAFARSIDPTIQTHLVLPPLSRAIDPLYLGQFSTVHHLPHCAYDKNLARGLVGVARFWRAAAAVPVEPDSLYIFADAEEPLMYQLFRKRLVRVPNVLKAKVQVTTPPLWLEDPRKRQLLRKTVLMMVYSAVLGEALPRMYLARPPHDSWAVVYRDYHDADLVYDTANAKRIDMREPSFVDLPYPGRFLEHAGRADAVGLPPGSILYFFNFDWHYDYLTEERFWEIQNAVLDAVAARWPGAPLYVKLHPMMTEDMLRHLRAPRWRLLRTDRSAEEVMIHGRSRIAAVYSTASTASLIGASLGIPSFVTYPLLYESEHVKTELDRYFEAPLRHLVRVHRRQDLGGGEASRASRDEAKAAETRWRECLTGLVLELNARLR